MTSTRTDRARTIRALEIEHDLIRRYARLIRELYARDDAAALAERISILVLEFGEDFVEGRHHAREERVLHVVFAREEAVIEARLLRLEDEWDAMRTHLEGMRRALDESEIGARVAFAWNAQALGNKLLLHLNRKEVELMPLLEGRLDETLDERLSGLLGLDDPAHVTDYAQAENVLLILASL